MIKQWSNYCGTSHLGRSNLIILEQIIFNSCNNMKVWKSLERKAYQKDATYHLKWHLALIKDVLTGVEPDGLVWCNQYLNQRELGRSLVFTHMHVFNRLNCLSLSSETISNPWTSSQVLQWRWGPRWGGRCCPARRSSTWGQLSWCWGLSWWWPVSWHWGLPEPSLVSVARKHKKKHTQRVKNKNIMSYKTLGNIFRVH